MKYSLKNTVAIACIIFFAGTMYVLTVRGVAGNPTPADARFLQGPTNPFELSPERGRFAHVLSLGETGQYSLTKELADFVYPDVGYYHGNFYGFFAPGISYMALPFYLWGKAFGLSQVFAYGFVSLASIIALIFIFKVGREILHLPVWAALFAVLTFAFGSTAWSYAISLYQHHVTTLFIMAGFYAAWRFAERARWSSAWGIVVWTCYGLALTIDYPNAILVAPVMAYFFFKSFSVYRSEKGVRIGLRTAFLVTGLVFVVIGVMHASFNAEHFGKWSRLAGSLVGYRVILENRILESPNPEAALTEIATRKGNVVGFFHEENFPEGISVLFFSTDRGIFFFGPIFILGFIGLLRRIRGASPEIVTLMALVGTHVFLYASWGDPWGGWAYGTRYLIPTMSILSLFLASFLAEAPRALWRRLVAFALFVYSSAVGLLGALTTNAIPPKSEAIPLGAKWNFLSNFDFFAAERSGSFIYRTYGVAFMSLAEYAVLLYAIVVLAALIILFIVPKYDHGN